ncbi:MAG: GNAT family N-acetyltransferase [Acidimicrobiia bacterium]|nr:GNAT family N-acetyltransferase [Acidimicrobiia bacterium]
MELRWPSHGLLPYYVAALERGWSPSSSRPDERRKQIEAIESDPDGFLAENIDLEGTAPPIELPDGTTVSRIPGYRKWMWDGGFCGGISFRWVADGDESLPPYVLGHIGYGIVDWKRRRGYATRALRMLLPDVRARGLDYVELTANEENIASCKVIEAAGGELHERFTMPDFQGGGPGRRYRIDLTTIDPEPSSPDDAS